MQRAWNVVCVLLLILSMAACDSLAPTVQEGEVVIPFENVVAEEWVTEVEIREPKLILLTGATDIAQIEPLVLPEHLILLQQADFAKYYLIALFRGIQPGSKHQVVIEQVSQHNDGVWILAQFWVPSGKEPVQAAETSPYQIVMIEKMNLDEGNVQLHLKSYEVIK